MKIIDILGMSLSNLWRRKIRSFLTILGVIIGTASIVVMLSIGLGLKQATMDEVSSAGGLTEIMVYSEDYGDGQLLLDDTTLEKFSALDHVKSVDPQISYSMALQSGKYESDSVTILGVTQDYLKKIELDRGKIPEPDADGSLVILFGDQVLGQDFFEISTGIYPYWERDEMPDVDVMRDPMFGGITKEEYEVADFDTSSSQTVTIANDVDPIFTEDDGEFDAEDADDPFAGYEDSNDTDMSSTASDDNTWNDLLDGADSSANGYSQFTSDVKRVPVKVSGITAGIESDYSDIPYNCYADIDSLKAFLKKNYSLNDVIPEQPVDRNGKPYKDLKYSQIVINVDSSEYVEDVLDELQNMGYHGEANKEWLEQVEQQFMLIEVALGGIGAVAMLVAAISIANTMTMSIYERTKEIGVMKVLGCGLGNIRSMFLSEAAFIGFLGGVAGVGLSFGLSVIVNRFVGPTVMEEYGYSSALNISLIPPWLVLAAIGFATVIGMLAGFFPAQRATKLSPLAAIRNE